MRYINIEDSLAEVKFTPRDNDFNYIQVVNKRDKSATTVDLIDHKIDSETNEHKITFDASIFEVGYYDFYAIVTRSLFTDEGIKYYTLLEFYNGADDKRVDLNKDKYVENTSPSEDSKKYKTL